jgi:hypothetical protein
MEALATAWEKQGVTWNADGHAAWGGVALCHAAELREALAAPTRDRGVLLNAMVHAGAAVVDARERLARTPQKRIADYERARVALVAAEARDVEANAALDAVGRYGSTPRVTA